MLMQVKSTLRKRLCNSRRYRDWALSRFKNAGTYQEVAKHLKSIREIVATQNDSLGHNKKLDLTVSICNRHIGLIELSR